MHHAISTSPTWPSYAALVISGIALLVAGISLWRSQLSPMRLIVASGPLTLRITQFSGNDNRIWYIAEVAADFTFTNSGAQSGVIRNLRIRVDYPDLPINKGHEYFSLTAEVDAKEYDKHAHDRRWLKHAMLNYGAPFTLLGGESKSKRLVFDSRWDQPVNQRTIAFTVEIYSSRSKKWRAYETWRHRLEESYWNGLIDRKMGLSQYPESWPRPDSNCSYPSNLHDYTGKPNSTPSQPDNRDYGFM
jgi:hypothetical protein